MVGRENTREFPVERTPQEYTGNEGATEEYWYFAAAPCPYTPLSVRPVAKRTLDHLTPFGYRRICNDRE
jgi:hypothetical protein